jgi:hypothetical protein
MSYRRYDGPLELGMVLTAPDNDGTLGYRRVKLVGQHMDGRWFMEDLPSKLRPRPDRSSYPIDEANLRIVFRPEEEQ